MQGENVKRVGLALGGGGAKGIAHIAYLKAVEELGVKPVIIAGTSSGALVGALYAGGMKPDEIYGIVAELFGEKKNFRYAYKRVKLMSSVFVSSAVKKYIAGILPRQSFEDLSIPLKVVTTNFGSLEEEVFDRGDLLGALMGSIAYPRVFGPQQIGEEYYIDGGATNIVPFDIIRNECDVLVAIDVSMTKPSGVKPSLRSSVRATWAASQNALISMRLKYANVDIFERPDFDHVSTMDFHKYKYVYERALEYTPGFKDKLIKML
jgi:NTE family protein